MNQILSTKLKDSNTQKSKKRNWFKFQFIISILIVSLLIVNVFHYFHYLIKEEDFSNNLIANYKIRQLYSNYKNTTNQKDNNDLNGLFGIIEIPKIGIYYPIFSHLTEDLLKISPCKFYGGGPNENGNICIAGHNYDNSLFFSKISYLDKADEIYIFDASGIQYIYAVYKIYEVKASDLSPIFDYETNEKTLTLITCNNMNSNRIIVRAQQKKAF